jgi:hypothetical protein
VAAGAVRDATVAGDDAGTGVMGGVGVIAAGLVVWLAAMLAWGGAALSGVVYPYRSPGVVLVAGGAVGIFAALRGGCSVAIGAEPTGVTPYRSPET